MNECGSFPGERSSPVVPLMLTNEDICAGRSVNEGIISFNEWVSAWNSLGCVNIFNDILFSGPNDRRVFNPSNLPSIQADMSNIFYTYAQEGYKIVESPTDPGFNSFQLTILNACQSVPGGCDSVLKKDCQPCTREQIASNNAYLSFCGCYAPPLPPDYGLATTPQCDPLCDRGDTVKKIDTKGNFLSCDANVCVIDDASITASQTSLGGISFNQVCSNCQPGVCKCIISNVSISEIASKTGITTTFNQQCAGNSECLQVSKENPDQLKVVNCETTINPSAGNTEPGILIPTWIILIIIFFVIVAILVILAGTSGRT